MTLSNTALQRQQCTGFAPAPASKMEPEVMMKAVLGILQDQLNHSPEFARFQRAHERRLERATAYVEDGRSKIARAEAKRARRRERNMRNVSAS
jgi:hypothetical protein